MKKVLWFLLVAMISFGYAKPATNPTHVIALWGQSNMLGAQLTPALPYTAAGDSVLMYDHYATHTWVHFADSIKPYIHGYPTRPSPSVSPTLGNRLIKLIGNSNVSFGFLISAIGGYGTTPPGFGTSDTATTGTAWSMSGANHRDTSYIYGRALKMIDSTKAPEAIIYWGSEADIGQTHRDSTVHCLRRMIANARADIGNANLPFFLIKPYYYLGYTYAVDSTNDTIRAAYDTVGLDVNVHIVADAKYFTRYPGDGVHVLKSGQESAAEMLAYSLYHYLYQDTTQERVFDTRDKRQALWTYPCSSSTTIPYCPWMLKKISEFPSAFINAARSDGLDIKVFDSTRTLIPRTLVGFVRSTKSGYIRIMKKNLPAAPASVKLYFECGSNDSIPNDKSAVASAGVVALWPMNDTFYTDLSGDYNGVKVRKHTIKTTGPLGSIDSVGKGDSGYVNIPDPTTKSLSFGDGIRPLPSSYMATCKFPDSSNHYFFVKTAHNSGAANDSSEYKIDFALGIPRVIDYNSNRSNISKGRKSKIIPQGKVYHTYSWIIPTGDSSSSRIWIDKVRVDTSLALSGIYVAQKNGLVPLALQAWPIYTGQWSTGCFGEMAILNRSIDTNETKLYNQFIMNPTGQGSILSVPVIDSIVPAVGPAAGGTAVHIYGTGFTPANTGAIGGVALTSVVTVDTQNITAVTGAHAGGYATLSITNGNTLTGTKTSAFNYTVPAASGHNRRDSWGFWVGFGFKKR